MELRQVEVYRPERSIITDNGRETLPGKYVIGVFHGWENYKDGEDFSRNYAIVELEDGTVKRYEVGDIRFTGKPTGANMFEDGELTPN